ncbi:hypothetical protein INT45_003640 [Circinella minor]|uniref:Uncharacterized protein n=1 Tax=Circinella minor TaxID=1195481 RepID=A0A8H7VJ75_9FUNG|nr:hypothetical protein INT45_003640 [Circinella minor]
MRFITLSAAIAALLAIATVQAAPAAQDQDAKQVLPTPGNNSTAPAPISLTTAQLNQCITQIVDKDVKLCDLTQLDGLNFPEKKDKKNDVPPPVKINDRIIELDALTTLVSKATDKLNDKGKTVNVNSVQESVTDLVKNLPGDQQVNSASLNKRVDKESSASGDKTKTEILAKSGMSYDQVKSLVGKALTQLKVNPPVAKNLKPKIKKSICETLTEHHIECDKILPYLAKEGSLA